MTRIRVTAVLCFALLCLLGNESAFAQSLEWQIAPESRAASEKPMEGVHDHGKFDWYDDGEVDCCSNEHCKPFTDKHITENPDGSVTLRYYDTTLKETVTVPFSQGQIRERPSTAEPDDYWHPCFSVNRTERSSQIEVHPYCIFKPDRSI